MGHQNNVAQLKEAGEMALKLQQEEHRTRESESKKDKRSLKLELKELELAHEDAIRDLKQELDKEREERNYFQLERDKINTFWEISKKELKDREMEELEERHQVEIKVYKQKVKHLLYEHQNNVAQLKEAGEMALKLQQEEHRTRESESKKDKRSLKLE